MQGGARNLSYFREGFCLSLLVGSLAALLDLAPSAGGRSPQCRGGPPSATSPPSTCEKRNSSGDANNQLSRKLTEVPLLR